MQDLPLVTTMGSLNVSGRLNRVLDALSLELGFDGPIDVARAAEWVPPPVHVAGTTRVRGTLTGPLDTIELVVRFDAPALTVGTEQALVASGELLIDRPRLVANRLTASPQTGGEIHAALDVPFGAEPVLMTATWQGVDARALMRDAEVAVQPVGTRLDGEARFTSGPRRSLALKTDLTALQAPDVTPLGGTVSASLDGATWTLTHYLRADGITVKGRAGGQLDAERAGRSTMGGPSVVVIESLAAADRALVPLGIRIPEAVRSAPGAIEAEVTVGGTFDDPNVALLARAPSFDIPGVGVSSLTAAVEAVSTGVFRPGSGVIYLKNTNVTGTADIGINYGLGGDKPVTGDWNGDGVDTIGVYRNGVFYLRNSNTVGNAEIYFAFGSPGDQPISGDWDGDGKDTIGVYRSSNMTFYLRDSNTAGPPNYVFQLGIPGDVGLAGDWTRKGSDTVGVFRPSSGIIFLKNTNQTGYADIALNYGIPNDAGYRGLEQ